MLLNGDFLVLSVWDFDPLQASRPKIKHADVSVSLLASCTHRRTGKRNKHTHLVVVFQYFAKFVLLYT